MEIIKIKDLSFTYPLESKPALNDISLAITQGEFVTVCGKSGCGKSTLLRQLKPAVLPHGRKSGMVYLGGRDINELTQKEQAETIGFVFQNPDNQIVTDKVWHELAFGLESLSYSTTEIRNRVSEMASFFGIGSWFHKKVTELSGGQKQLLNLAAVMVMQPSVLILDEPTSQLDPIAAQDFLETVHKINRELGVTVILTEHRLEEVFPMSDRVIVMEDGKILICDTPQKVGCALNGMNHDMLFALPTPMRVYFSKENDDFCPLTIREGRQWLSRMPIQRKVVAAKEQGFSNQSVLNLKDVWFRYEKDAPDVLKGVSLSVKEGEIYAVLGENGSGKTTMFSVIAGVEKPYRGRVRVSEGKKTAMLPQNPQSLFVRKTVELELYEMLSNTELTGEEKDARVQPVIAFCELSDLLIRHPYDLSGGEQQRVALAKVLLTKPDILLLDEPTKGLDAHFKAKLARMLKELLKRGVAILMVSHDIEFCAKYADKCGMFFDGIITSEDTPRRFFLAKSFYTTAANRMSRGIIDNAILDEDIIAAVGGCVNEQDDDPKSQIVCENRPEGKETQNRKTRNRPGLKNCIAGVVFAFLFAGLQFFAADPNNGIAGCVFQVLGIICLSIALSNLIPKKIIGINCVSVKANKTTVSRRTIIAAVIILLLVPITILAGVYWLDNRKYYFISLLIILETMIPFAMVFEGRKPKPRELVIISVLCALAVSGRTAFAMLPQFKPVVAIVIITGVCFGGESGFLVGAITGFVSNFFFGQTPYTPWQMFAFGIIGFLAGILFDKGMIKKTKSALCIFGFIATLVVYGGIMNPASVIVFWENPTKEMFISSFIMGFPYDMVHAVSTAFFLYFIAEPMIEKLERIKIKYGLAEPIKSQS